MNTVVLGLGNTLLRDEGVGVHVVERLNERYVLPADVTVIDGGTAGLELLYQLAGCERLIVCDAVNADAPPASVLSFTDEQVPAFFQRRLSPHQVGLADVLATLQLTDAAPEHLSLIDSLKKECPADWDAQKKEIETKKAALLAKINWWDQEHIAGGWVGG